MPLNSAEPLVARILIATATVANPVQPINSNGSKSRPGQATDRVGVSVDTSSKEDTVIGGRQPDPRGRGARDGSGPDGFGKHAAGMSSSVQAFDRADDTGDSSEGMTTECSPVEVFDGEEEVYNRVRPVRPEGNKRPGRLQRLARAVRPEQAQERPSAPSAGTHVVPKMGRRVKVFWDGEHAWFEGVIEHVDGENGLMYVVYDDGDEAWEAYGGECRASWMYVDEKKNVDDSVPVRGERGTAAPPKPVREAAAQDHVTGVVKGQLKGSASQPQKGTPKNTSNEHDIPVKRKRKSLAGVDDHLRARIGSEAKAATPKREMPVSSKGQRAPMVKMPPESGLNTVPIDEILPAKRNKRLQALIGGPRRTSDLASPQPGNVTNHTRRAKETAKNTPDSAPKAGGIHGKKGPVSKTGIARKAAAVPAVSLPKASAAKVPTVVPAKANTPAPSPAVKPDANHVDHAQTKPRNLAKKKKPVTLGDIHDLSSNPNEDEEDITFNNETDVNFTARDAGDEADIFALDALNEAIVRAVDSQSTLANKISHQKLSLLKLEMKHALEEAHNKAKNKLSEVSHTSRVSCTNAINTLNSKISEMELFMQQQRVTFNSMQSQCQALRETAEHTIQSSEKKIHSLHATEMGSLRKLHEVLYESYTDGVAYIKDYAERMTAVGRRGKLGKAVKA